MTPIETISPSASEALAFPNGATPLEDGRVFFSVVSEFADSVTLCLFTDLDRPYRETEQIALLKGERNRWSVFVRGIPEGSTYGYRVDGPWEPSEGHFFLPEKLLLDPYARCIDGPSRYVDSMRSMRQDRKPIRADSGVHAPRALVPRPDYYDWENDAPPRIPMTDSTFCELHVKGFSKLNPAVPEELRGTYAGLAHESSIAYLRDLGITTVQLLPVHHHLDDSFLLEKGLVNYWGYNTIGFFAPEAGYASGDDPVSEFRDMVKAFHRAGMEVVLDVVYNHTGEAGQTGPTCFFRGFDNLNYYHSVPGKPAHYYDTTGCGNSVDVSHPQVLALVLDSLRYWVSEMHVDGFRFDLAVEMCRDELGFNQRCAFLQAIFQDPVLKQVKLIAEPWDLGPDGYQLGGFPIDWAELNGKFRDDVRQFWRGDPGITGDFARRLTGSEQQFGYNGRGPWASVNLITSHDGFTLNDLVSYNDKHNLANGEKNRDGDSHNISYNHGTEGPTKDKAIIEIRQRQIRNFLATMICSQGVPFLLAGDERLRTQKGNNNTYCQDNELSWISWDDSEEAKALREFVKRLFQLRRDHPPLRRSRFFTGEADLETGIPDVCWLRPDGAIKESADWNQKKAGAFAMMIHAEDGEKALLFFFNARSEETKFVFPKTPVKLWNLLVDTAEPERAEPGQERETKKKSESHKLLGRSMQIWEQA